MPKQKPEQTDILGEIVWPKEVLQRAREAVVAYRYVVGADEHILAGEHDHWAVIQIACYAQYDNTADIPRKLPKFKPKTTEQKLKFKQQELADRLDVLVKNIKVRV